MAFSTTQVPVDTSGELLVTAPSTAGVTVSSYTFQNMGATDCLLGSTQAVSNGFLLKSGAAWSADLWPGDKVYAKTSAGSTTVSVAKVEPS